MRAGKWRQMRIRQASFFVLTAIFLWCSPATAAAGPDPACFSTLKQKLVSDGFDRAVVDSLFNRPQVAFDAKGVSAFFTYRESRLNYDQFSSPRNIDKARAYAEKHREVLESVERQYGVDRHVITAILLVETRLGTYLGDRSIFNTLATMASLADPDVRKTLWEQIPRKKRFSREKYEEKADRKSGWAYRELKAFLRHTAGERIDPMTVQGSFAGAMGIAQFMPSNVVALGRDGNGDGQVNLFEHADAIASVANYLKHHGWRSDIEREQAFRVLMRYNASSYYVKAVLNIVEKLKG